MRYLLQEEEPGPSPQVVLPLPDDDFSALEVPDEDFEQSEAEAPADEEQVDSRAMGAPTMKKIMIMGRHLRHSSRLLNQRRFHQRKGSSHSISTKCDH